jgi:hypothetical protein
MPKAMIAKLCTPVKTGFSIGFELRMVEFMRNLPKFLSALVPLLATTSLLSPNTASAAAGSDLKPTITVSGSTLVGTPTRYDVRILNTGNKRSNATTVSIQLPKTNTSPTVFVMGTLGTVPTGCTKTGTRLICSFPNGIARNSVSAPIGFDLTLPYSASPIALRVDVDTNNDTNYANNNTTSTAMQTYQTVTPPAVNFAVTNQHCTGTNLSSYFECIVSPGSVATHPATFLANGAIDLGDPDYLGAWAVSGTQLTFSYTELGQPFGSFIGQGVSAGGPGQNCWDGRLTTGGPSTVMYRVCF